MSKYFLYTIIALAVPLLVSLFLTKIICRKKQITGFKKVSFFVLLSLILTALVCLTYLLPYARAEDKAL